MNDVGAAPSLSDGAPNHLLSDEARRDSPSQPPPASSPPTLNGDGHKTPDAPAVDDEAASGKGDSEAETIIQSGREELSPEKKKTYVQHTVDQSEENRDSGDNAETMAVATDDGNARKRKRAADDDTNGQHAIDAPSRGSSRPSSKRSSTSRQLKREKSEEPQVRAIMRESSPGEPPATGKSMGIKKSPSRDRSTGVGREAAPRRKIHRQRASDASRADEPEETNNNNNSNNNNIDNDTRNNNNSSYARRASNGRSTSPAVPFHKRASPNSTLSSSTRPQKKKRAPPPLLTDHSRHRSEDRDSNSSRSGSPLTTARGSKVPSSDYFAAMKYPGVRRRDQNGRTRLARACAAQEIEAAKEFHTSQPEDLNIPDNAGNTPLQIAALEGCVELVKYLLDAGCDVHTKNIDKDTPLIDAVENGHLEVIKLLLDAGVNPRAGNAQGDEPYDLVPSDSENYEEIRRVIKEAKTKAKSGLARRKSEDFGSKGIGPSHDAAVTSPHEMNQAAGARSPPPPMAAGTRRKTVRGDPTRNDLLWTSATPENLRHFAAKGDLAGVVNILNVRPNADNESIIAAAKGGHDEVLGLLLGLGNPDADPEPIKSGSHKPGYNTPMLAAIGRGNTKVVRLLLDQSGFNPTRTPYIGRKYYELSQERKGENWEEEYQLLKDAYDNHAKPPKSRKPDTKSPQRTRDKGRAVKETLRRESPSSSPESMTRKKSAKPSLSNLSKESTTVKDKKSRGGIEKPSQKPKRRESIHVTTAASDHDASQHHPISRHSMTSPEEKSHEDSVRGQEQVKRKRLIAGRPPADRKGRRASLISSDSHSSREEVFKAKMEDPPTESRANRSRSPLKRRRSSVSPQPPRRKEPQPRENEVQEPKRKKVRSDEEAVRHSPTDDKSENVEPQTGDSGHSKNDRVTKRRISDPIKEKKNSIKAESAEDAVSVADVNHQEQSPTLPANHAAEEEARKEKEAKEAEEKRLAEEAERERREREAKEAEEAREAAEKAARAAREKAEEEERKKKEEAELRRARQAEEEHQRRVEQERIRREKRQREQEEQERRRREALPNLLRAAADLIGSNDPQAKNHKWLEYCLPLHTVTTGQLDPSCTDPEVKAERWTPNYQVAPLLGTNDLQLSQYPSWEKRVATPTQRNNLWRVTGNLLTYSAVLNPLRASITDYWNRNRETFPKFEAMEHVFWVKLSDFMDLVPHIPHLPGLKLRTAAMHIDPEPSDATAKLESHWAPDRDADEGLHDEDVNTTLQRDAQLEKHH